MLSRCVAVVGRSAHAQQWSSLVQRSWARAASSSSAGSGDAVVVTWDVDEKKNETGVCVVTLNRPDKLNALSVEVGREIREHMSKLQQEPRLRCLVITGNGRAFSAGGDFDFLQDRIRSSAEENTGHMLRFYDRFLSIRRVPVPTIAAINGHAVGAGLCLALASDLRIAGKGAKLGVNFTKLGLHPGLASTHFLSKTGELISADEAEKIGMVLQSVEQQDVMPTALRLARDIAANSPVAVRLLTKSMRMKEERGLADALIREADGQVRRAA